MALGIGALTFTTYVSWKIIKAITSSCKSVYNSIFSTKEDDEKGQDPAVIQAENEEKEAIIKYRKLLRAQEKAVAAKREASAQKKKTIKDVNAAFLVADQAINNKLQLIEGNNSDIDTGISVRDIVKKFEADNELSKRSRSIAAAAANLEEIPVAPALDDNKSEESKSSVHVAALKHSRSCPSLPALH